MATFHSSSDREFRISESVEFLRMLWHRQELLAQSVERIVVAVSLDVITFCSDFLTKHLQTVVAGFVHLA